MRSALLLAVVLTASPLSAQQWTPEQQSLIDHIAVCWDAWVAATADETPEQFFRACPQDARGHYWWTADGAPDVLIAGVQRNWHVTREIDDSWVSIRPIYVDIFGDVGIIHMYGYWRANTPDGTVMTEDKRTEVFQRRNGAWVLIGAQSGPATPADGEPYRR